MDPDTHNKSQLLAILREGVGLVQMILFKELRAFLGQKQEREDRLYLSMLAGAITNELFGTQNPEKKFQVFREENRALIEQGLLGLSQDLPALRSNITDALRVQTLCDNQEGYDSTANLTRADEIGILIKDREVPLPSTFMTMIRTLGEQHGLIIPPVLITSEDDTTVLH
jgi:hypothetical protein